MLKKTLYTSLILTLLLGFGCQAKQNPSSKKTEGLPKLTKIHKTDAEWKAQLTEEQYYITRQQGTERAFTGKYNDEKRDGDYVCVSCDLKLFDAKTKFDSGTGWPSYWQPVEGAVASKVDKKLWMVRTEVLCARCDAHLGHVFDDGPEPTGKRYCINSAALLFKPKN